MTHKAVCVGPEIEAVVEIQDGGGVRAVCDSCRVEEDGAGFREMVKSSMVLVLAGIGAVGKPAEPFRFECRAR